MISSILYIYALYLVIPLNQKCLNQFVKAKTASSKTWSTVGYTAMSRCPDFCLQDFDIKKYWKGRKWVGNKKHQIRNLKQLYRPRGCNRRMTNVPEGGLWGTQATVNLPSQLVPHKHCPNHFWRIRPHRFFTYCRCVWRKKPSFFPSPCIE